MSVLGDTDSELLTVITELDDAKLSTAIHHAVSSTLLVSAATPLGVMWRHPLMRDAVRDLLLPLEQQTLARRAADHLANRTTEPTEGQLRQAAEMYELAGYPDLAARELIHAARAAVRDAALDVAEHHLAAAHALTVPPHLARLGITAREVEILRLVNAGLSNADISHRLFISTRTVESHVSSMLQKTGLTTREQLPSASTAED